MNPAPPAGEKEKILDWGEEKFDHIRKTELKMARTWPIEESPRRFWDYHYTKNAQKCFKR